MYPSNPSQRPRTCLFCSFWSVCVVRVGGDDGELQPWHYICIQHREWTDNENQIRQCISESTEAAPRPGPCWMREQARGAYEVAVLVLIQGSLHIQRETAFRDRRRPTVWSGFICRLWIWSPHGKPLRWYSGPSLMFCEIGVWPTKSLPR